MAKVKNNRWLKWLLIILGVVVLAIAAFFIIKPIVDNAQYGVKERNIEDTVDGITIKLVSIERLPMQDEKCQERVIVMGSDEDEDCVIANVTITNTTDEDYDYSYRKFGLRSERNQNISDKPYGLAITKLTSRESVDVTKTLAPGESHSQEVHLQFDSNRDLDTYQLIYRVSPDSKAEISLQL